MPLPFLATWPGKGIFSFILCVIDQEVASYKLYIYRRVHTMKVMRIGSELIRIACVHIECALTAIRIEFALSQSTSIGGLKPV